MNIKLYDDFMDSDEISHFPFIFIRQLSVGGFIVRTFCQIVDNNVNK